MIRKSYAKQLSCYEMNILLKDLYKWFVREPKFFLPSRQMISQNDPFEWPRSAETRWTWKRSKRRMDFLWKLVSNTKENMLKISPDKKHFWICAFWDKLVCTLQWMEELTTWTQLRVAWQRLRRKMLGWKHHLLSLHPHWYWNNLSQWYLLPRIT